MNDGLWPYTCAVFNSRRLHRKPQRRLGFSSFVPVGGSGTSLSWAHFLEKVLEGERKLTVDEFLAARLIPPPGVGPVSLQDMDRAIAEGAIDRGSV